LLAHRGLACSKRVEHVLALLGVLSAQFGPAYWVAIHRRHHQFVDDVGHDPHSPRTGFWWSHFGWLFKRHENTDPLPILERYAKDLLRDPLYAWLEFYGAWGTICLIVAVLYFAAGAFVVLQTGGTTAEAVQFGASLVVWGVAVRTVWVWHITWSVNSVAHRWGYRNYDTPDGSRNNVIVGILAFGEGWHNNHHASPRSVRHGQRWWELDLTWLVIRLLARMNVVQILDTAAPRPRPAH
jgi:stearoyl-CoA desaturase (delta-9 desaturase)